MPPPAAAVNGAALPPCGLQAPCFAVPESPACEQFDPYPIYSWFSAEYLFWAVREQRLATPLVTTSLSGGGGGVIGDPDTVTLVGQKEIDLDGISGVRLSGGLYDARLNVILEGSLMGFPRVTEKTFEASDDTGLPVLARPFIDSETGQPSAFLIAFPGAFSGNVTVEAEHRLVGAEINLGCHVCADEDWNLDLLAGFRFMRLDEKLEITDNTTVLVDGIAFFLGQEINEGDVRIRNDRFETVNKFYGGQVGFRTEACCGPLFVKLKAMAAVGTTDGELLIRGKSTLIQQGVVTATAPGGLLALPTNIGRFQREDTIFVPQVEITAGVQLGDCLRIFAGYGFIYWSDVIRPAEQLPQSINPAFVPTSPVFGEGGAPIPQPFVDQTSYWVHGLHVGVAVRF
jgi:hypothetical protein